MCFATLAILIVSNKCEPESLPWLDTTIVRKVYENENEDNDPGCWVAQGHAQD
jgi:hypothetical protein